jgi:site-specific recombinase XerD
LRARNLAPKTIETYLEAAGQLVDYVTAAGVGSMEIERHHVEDFIAEQIETHSAATASVRCRALQQFFTWCLDEEELDVNPMAKMRPPVVPERPVPVLGEDKARALLKACAGSGFVPRRDTAIVRLFLDTGMRLSELAKLRVDDVDLSDDVAIVTGKGRRPRACPFGSRTAQALDRYVRTRSRQPQAGLPALWLGANGRAAMTDNGIAQMIRKSRPTATTVQVCRLRTATPLSLTSVALRRVASRSPTRARLPSASSTAGPARSGWRRRWISRLIARAVAEVVQVIASRGRPRAAGRDRRR